MPDTAVPVTDPLAAAEAALQQAETAAHTRTATAAARVSAAVDRWLASHIAGGPVARTVECWNHLAAALPALKAELTKEIA